MPDARGLRVALVHEWLVGWGGSESVLVSLSRLFPEAPIYTLVHHPDEHVRRAFEGRDIRTTGLQRLPAVGRYYPSTLPLMPGAWASVDLGVFDLVISSSHSFAKSVRVRDNALHVCYCHTPPRYLWDLNATYRRGQAALLRGPLLERLRHQDLEAARRVGAFVANSAFVAQRIRATYGRDSAVVPPPVDVEAFRAPPTADGPGGYYLAGGRLVGYKRVDLAVEASNRAGFPLVVFGDGPERRGLEKAAGPTVSFVGAVGHDRLVELMAGCRAFLYPGVEDFGILPVEVQAAGRPVVALGRGGALDTVEAGVTGVLYDDETVDGLLEAVQEIESRTWSPEACRASARRFERGRFEERMRGHLDELLEAHGPRPARVPAARRDARGPRVVGEAPDAPAGPSSPRVAAVVLNWCGEVVSRACLDSLRCTTYPGLRVLLVDNGSEDGSGERLHQAYPGVDYLQTGCNLGFTGGNNRGIQWALEHEAEYVLVLNNDTVVEADAVGLMVEAAERAQGAPVGGVAPKILAHDDPTRIWYAGGHFSPLYGSGVHWREGRPDTPSADGGVRDVSFMTGCCLLLSAGALGDVGGFTEELFAYGEDADLSLRLSRAGYRLLYQPAARILHHVGPPGAAPTPFQIRQRDVNRRWIMRRHFSWLRRVPFLLRFYATRVLLMARYAAGGDAARVRAIVGGMFGGVGVGGR